MSPSPRRPIARHGRLSSPRPFAQVLKIVGVVLAVVLVSTGGVAAYALNELATGIQEEAVVIEGQEPLPPDIGAIEGGVSMLVVGTDECEEEFAGYFGDRCTGDASESTLNDVNMLLHISDEPRRVTVVSFPRDLMVPIPECTDAEGYTSSAMRKQQINSAWFYGGLNCVVQTVQQLSGQSIPLAAKVSFGNVINITDAIGGVEVCVGADGIRDSNTGLDMAPGMHEVQGLQALQFLRTRYGIGDGSDLARVSNQQQYLSRMAAKLVSDEVMGDPATLYRLALAGSRNITPSESLTNPMTLMQIALAVKDVPFDQIVFVSYPTYTDPDNEFRLVPNYDAAEALWAALATNQPITLSGEGYNGGGVLTVEPDPAPEAPVEGEAPVEAAPGGEPAPAPAPEATIQLPNEIAGTTAAVETCAAGRQWG